ncbi:hypothetical protein P0Y35_08565 [Kiritimatiellaeota bacterium B1221]|nr:hypothetical protein [Kiritimatiellaeota bacterium B1221]
MPPPGKIASLPHKIRQEVNMRLLNGETSTRILPWLNALPEVKEVLTLRFSGADVNDENLSNWRQNQFRDWERKREKEESIKTVAEYASRLAHTAGSNMSAGAQAIATGKIMELLEASAFDDESSQILLERSPHFVRRISVSYNWIREHAPSTWPRLSSSGKPRISLSSGTITRKPKRWPPARKNEP